MSQHVRLEVPLERGPEGAEGAGEGLLPGVRAHVFVQFGREGELPLAEVTPVAPLADGRGSGGERKCRRRCKRRSK